MSETHREVPPVTLVRPIVFNRAAQLRAELNETGPLHFSINDVLSYAAVRALVEHPALNATFQNGEICYHRNVNMGIAVAVEEGLIVPVIRCAQDESLSGFAQSAAARVKAAHTRRLKPEDVQEGTFTVTNLGMYGITHFNPIINRPQVAILGLCALEKVVSLRDGRSTEDTIFRAALTVDHRVLDGATAARFLQRLAELIERPSQLLMTP